MVIDDATNFNYDLQERTAKFGENVIKFCKALDQNALKLFSGKKQ
jgi:hypothetical protein